MSTKKSQSFESAGSFLLKNSDCLLVHGVINIVDLSEMPYAWIRKGNKVYDVEHDKWYDINDWNRNAVEKNTYTYKQVLKLLDFTSHLGPWTDEEFSKCISE